mmetsp:Transcript_12635/g.37249  ORF Transcript_12635/g.37249 Transcript_12635/m.37249 type:complete len:202 (-) Transcript_12635:505-1110(-)
MKSFNSNSARLSHQDCLSEALACPENSCAIRNGTSGIFLPTAASLARSLASCSADAMVGRAESNFLLFDLKYWSALYRNDATSMMASETIRAAHPAPGSSIQTTSRIASATSATVTEPPRANTIRYFPAAAASFASICSTTSVGIPDRTLLSGSGISISNSSPRPTSLPNLNRRRKDFSSYAAGFRNFMEGLSMYLCSLAL